MTARPVAPATERNRGPILEILEQEFSDCRNVLEIGSGTGQHAVWFARHMPHLRWQTSDLEENHAAITAWIEWSRLSNVEYPMEIDVARCDLPSGRIDAVFSANTAHIMSLSMVESMFSLVGRLLPAAGVFCLYGPFRDGGTFSSDSNEIFDRSLKERDPSMGIRDLEYLDELASQAGMLRRSSYAMPANNLMLLWQKNDEVVAG